MTSYALTRKMVCMPSLFHSACQFHYTDTNQKVKFGMWMILSKLCFLFLNLLQHAFLITWTLHKDTYHFATVAQKCRISWFAQRAKQRKILILIGEKYLQRQYNPHLSPRNQWSVHRSKLRRILFLCWNRGFHIIKLWRDPECLRV